MAKLTIAGIPIHPLINDLPAALIPVTAVCDVIGMVTGDKSWSKTAYHTLILSLFSGVGAGLAGAVDYTGVPSRPTTEKNAANIHALLNTGILALGFWNFLLRRDRPGRPSSLARLLSFLSVPLLLYSGLEGAILAYRYRMAETPQEEITQPEQNLPEVPPTKVPRKRAA